ncbi:hypothetical protein FA13DRAFT_1804066 [Coprinellus micaceus]|uniref:Uncharacterized protein n=1 Tax=Coprinellus micaceus TaxID=71717 RepID=A0A4Y7SAA6_COPMI|nr:hypothetical protein FA13DRAFT_1804066 [Coprinellus micaceus]
MKARSSILTNLNLRAPLQCAQQQPQYAPYPPQQHQQQYPPQAYGDGADDMEDAYGGYVVNDPPTQAPQQGSPNRNIPNPYDQPKQGANQSRQADGYASGDDDEPRMVLKVANQ